MVSVCLVIVVLGVTAGGQAQVIGQVGAGGATAEQGIRQLVRFRTSYGGGWRSPAQAVSLRTGKSRTIYMVILLTVSKIGLCLQRGGLYMYMGIMKNIISQKSCLIRCNTNILV